MLLCTGLKAILTILSKHIVESRDASIGNDDVNPSVGRVGYCLLEHSQLVLPLSHIALDKSRGAFQIQLRSILRHLLLPFEIRLDFLCTFFVYVPKHHECTCGRSVLVLELLERVEPCSNQSSRVLFAHAVCPFIGVS